MGERSERMAMASAVANVVGHPDTPNVLRSAVEAGLHGRHADLLLVFASAHFDDELDSILDCLTDSLKPRATIGATAEAVVAGALEYEHQPALVVCAAHMPGVHISSFHLSDEEELERLGEDDDLRDHIGVPADANAYFMLTGDPFSFGRGTLELLERLNSAYPGRPALGGLASAAQEAGQNRVIFDGEVLRHGLSGVGLWGNLAIDTVVSQGCRPIGRHFVITKAEQNIIHTLGGRPPRDVVYEVFNTAPSRDRELVKQRGLLVGRVINEYQATFGRGDFLIRNPIGFDQGSGAMAVDELVRIGQTIQFHVRDSDSASEDLRSLLAQPRPAPPAGAIIFSCNGRGSQLFNDRNHDARALSEAVTGAPVAGFFCAGEIGPVGNRNFLHGHTASIGFIRPAEAPKS